MDTGSDGRIGGGDAFSDSELVEGKCSPTVDISAILDVELATGGDLKVRGAATASRCSA